MAVHSDKAPASAVIGLACLLGSATLAWLSSPATLHLSSDSENRVSATIEARLFGLIARGAQRVDGIRSLTVQRVGGPGQPDSDTPDRIVFETALGPVDLGRDQQLFADDRAEIAAFLQADGPASLSLSSIARGRETRRFVLAQIVAVALCLGGLGLLWTAVRSRFA